MKTPKNIMVPTGPHEELVILYVNEFEYKPAFNGYRFNGQPTANRVYKAVKNNLNNSYRIEIPGDDKASEMGLHGIAITGLRVNNKALQYDMDELTPENMHEYTIEADDYRKISDWMQELYPIEKAKVTQQEVDDAIADLLNNVNEEDEDEDEDGDATQFEYIASKIASIAEIDQDVADKLESFIDYVAMGIRFDSQRPYKITDILDNKTTYVYRVSSLAENYINPAASKETIVHEIMFQSLKELSREWKKSQ